MKIEHKVFKDIIDYFYDLDERVNPHSVITKARKAGRARLAQKAKRV